MPTYPPPAIARARALWILLIVTLVLALGVIWPRSFSLYAGLGSPVRIATLDLEQRIDPAFRVPRGLEPIAEFWLRIYTEFSSQQLVLFDERHPELIYEVLDLRQLLPRSRNAVAFEISSERLIRERVGAYRAAFIRLIRQPNPEHPDPIEARILATRKLLDHPHPMRELARSLRVQRGQRDHLLAGLARAEAYFPKIERIFEQVGVPWQISRLSLVESSFNHHAVSQVGASGVWQFMRDSAQEFLLLDEGRRIDERLSPLKASVAAASLLKRNFGLFKSWPLAITSYNHGFTAIRSLMLTRLEREFVTPVYDVAEFFEPCSLKSPSRKPLGWASRNFYLGFLAVLHAEQYRDLFFTDRPESDYERAAPWLAQQRLASVARGTVLPTPYVAFEQLVRAKSVARIARERGVAPERLHALNPDIKSTTAELPSGFWLVVPTNEEARDLDNLRQKLRTVSLREALYRRQTTQIQSSRETGSARPLVGPKHMHNAGS